VSLDATILGFSWIQVGAVLLAMLLGGICKGIVGIALPLVGLSVMLLALPPKLAVATMVIPILVTNIQLALSGGTQGLVEAASRFWPLMLTCIVSIFTVSLFAANWPAETILLMLGFVVLFFVAMNVSRWKPHVSPRWERPAGVLAGIASGLVGGATSAYGPPLTMYLIAVGVPKHKWSSSVGMTFGVGGLPLLAGYIANGLLTPQIAALSAVACIPAYVGMWIGMRLQNAMHPDTFRKVLLAALFLMALNLVRRGLA
jgi:uncharacterized membrane protein YfcA